MQTRPEELRDDLNNQFNNLVKAKKQLKQVLVMLNETYDSLLNRVLSIKNNKKAKVSVLACLELEYSRLHVEKLTDYYLTDDFINLLRLLPDFKKVLDKILTLKEHYPHNLRDARAILDEWKGELTVERLKSEAANLIIPEIPSTFDPSIEEVTKQLQLIINENKTIPEKQEKAQKEIIELNFQNKLVGQIKKYLKTRDQEYALRDKFSQIGATLFGCFGYQSEKNARHHYLEKELIPALIAHFETPNFDKLHSIIESGRQRFKSHAKINEPGYDKTIQCLLAGFEMQLVEQRKATQPIRLKA